MKKIILSLLLFISLSSLYSTQVNVVSQNTLGLGGANLADLSGVSNPANLGKRGENDPSLITYFSLNERLYPGNFSTPLGFFQYPNMNMGVTVFGTNLSLTIDLENSLEDRSYSNNLLSYTGYNRFLLQLDWGYELNDIIDFGMRVKGGSTVERKNFELRENFFFIPDYIVNSFFSTYTPVSDSDFFSLAFALRLNLFNNLCIAIMSESNLDLSTNSSTNNITTYLKEASFGLTYISNIYSLENKLNPFVYKASLDLVYIGDSINRELRFGNELKMQLANNNSISLRVGYFEKKDTIAKIFVFDKNEGVSTYALAYNNSSFGISGFLYLPLISFSDLDNGFTIGINTIFRF